MPKFGRIKKDFRVTLTDQVSGEDVRFFFVLTVQQQHNLIMAHTEFLTPDPQKLWPIALTSLRGWEGVEDEEGRPIECSRQNLECYLPMPLREMLRFRFWAAAMGFSAESDDAATTSPDSDTSEQVEPTAPPGERPASELADEE